MKQTIRAGSIIFTLLLGAPTLMHAQDNQTMILDRITSDEMLRSTVILVLVYFVSHFILTLIRLYLNHRLKVKMVEAGTHELAINQLLRANRNEKKAALKYFCLLSGVGAGFFLITVMQPALMAGLTTMIFCVALSSLGYFLLIKKMD